MSSLKINCLRFVLFTWPMIACNHGSTNNKDYQRDRVVSNQLSQLFSVGDHNTRMVTIGQLTNPQKQTLKKFLKIETADLSVRHLFDSVLNGSKSIQSQELSVRFGLTEEELDILLSIFDNKQTTSAQARVSVMNDGNNISFKGKGELKMLDSLLLNLKGTTARFKQSILTLQSVDTSQVANEFLPPGEGLNSTLVFSGPSTDAGTSTPATEYLLLIAKLNKSGKTYVFLNSEIHLNQGQIVNQFNSIIIDR